MNESSIRNIMQKAVDAPLLGAPEADFKELDFEKTNLIFIKTVSELGAIFLPDPEERTDELKEVGADVSQMLEPYSWRQRLWVLNALSAQILIDLQISNNERKSKLN